MLYLYDEVLVSDLISSFNSSAVQNPIVKVVDPEGAIELAAQIKSDNIQYPIVVLNRDQDISIDKDRWNFTRLHKGVQSVIDLETNELYYEKAIPINLSYKLHVITTSTADTDELVKELLFKYTSMYFLKFTLPYECRRQVRFGVVIDPDSSIERKSGSYEYLKAGQLHETVIPLKCEGCVLVSYTSAKLQRVDTNLDSLIDLSM